MPPCHGGGRRFESGRGRAPLAQWTEHLTSDQGVEGSSPSWGTEVEADIGLPRRVVAPVSEFGLAGSVPVDLPRKMKLRDGLGTGLENQGSANAGRGSTPPSSAPA